MKITKTLLTALSVTIMFASCKKESNNTTVAPSHRASIMFINGCAGTTQASGSFSGTVVSGATAVNLFSSSGYQYITLDTLYPAVPITFKTTSGTLLKDTTYACIENVHYTALLGGTLAKPSISFTKDELGGMTGGKAKIRFANLTGDLPNAAFEYGTTAQLNLIFSGVNPSQITSFAEVDPGTMTFCAYDPANKTATIRYFGLRQVEGGKYYTVFLSGTATGTANYNLQLTQVDNTP